MTQPFAISLAQQSGHPAIVDTPPSGPNYFGITGTAAGTGTPEAASFIRATVAGSVLAGARSVTISNVSTTVTASVDGVTLDPGQTVMWEASAGGSLDAIAYNPGPSGELVIVQVR